MFVAFASRVLPPSWAPSIYSRSSTAHPTGVIFFATSLVSFPAGYFPFSFSLRPFLVGLSPPLFNELGRARPRPDVPAACRIAAAARIAWSVLPRCGRTPLPRRMSRGNLNLLLSLWLAKFIFHSCPSPCRFSSSSFSLSLLLLPLRRVNCLFMYLWTTPLHLVEDLSPPFATTSRLTIARLCYY